MLQKTIAKLSVGVAATAGSFLALGGAAGASGLNINVHTMGPSSPVHVMVNGGGHHAKYKTPYKHFKNANYTKKAHVKYAAHKVHHVKKRVVCPLNYEWRMDWSKDNWGKTRCLPVVKYVVRHHSCKPVYHTSYNYVPVVHYYKPVKHEIKYDYDYKVDKPYVKYKHDYRPVRHEVKEVKTDYKRHDYDRHDYKVVEHPEEYKKHDYKPVEREHSYVTKKPEVRNYNNVKIYNNNRQTVRSGDAYVKHNTHVGDVSTGDAKAENHTNTNVTVNNDGEYGYRRVSNHNNVSVSNHNYQNVRSGSAHVYGNTHVGNVSTGNASAYNNTNTEVHLNN